MDILDGQISLFDKMLQDFSKKPHIGSRIIFYKDSFTYFCIVNAHEGFDYFYVVFSGRKPCDDNSNIARTNGWTLSMRGYKKEWKYE